MEEKIPAVDSDDPDRIARVRDPQRLRSMFAKLYSEDDSADRGDLVSQLKALAGTSSRTASGVDVKGAAALLGKSERAIRRWVNEGTQPNKDSLAAVHASQREAHVLRAHERGASQKSYLRVTARQGPTNDYSYLRERTVGLDMTPEQHEQLARIYSTQGEVAAMAWIEQHLRGRYMSGWTIDGWDVGRGGMEFGE